MKRITLRYRRGALLAQNLAMAFESLRSTGFRSFMTVLGVFIGVVIIIGVASVLNGFRQTIVDQFDRFGSQTIFITRMPMINFGRPDASIRRRSYFTLHDADAIRQQCPAVEDVTAMKGESAFNMSVKAGRDEVESPELRGILGNSLRVMAMEIELGRNMTEDEVRRNAPVCIIGHNIANSLFPSINPVDRVVTLGARRLRVIGVLAKAMEGALDGGAAEDNLVFVPLGIFQRMFPYNREFFLVARARHGMVQQAVTQIEETLRIRRGVGWFDDNDFDVGTSDTIIATFDKIAFAAVSVMIALSMVAFIVGGVGVTNVMFASVKERTREIGIRRAIGARQGDIVSQFLLEAMAMTGFGGLLGVVLGEAFMRAVAWLVPAMPCATPMWARLFGFLGSVGVGLVFGLWPAVTAARQDPIEALRYE